uniref:Uncharacterized protein n=1 Tax=Octactis speculum TaxID=3111310 RepID=A0A7S2B5H8_9STRA|mmetsp:Transcript_19655/g.26645  ORF Transcript_19655/g.26645 Transcript_19655/m.26645 type:complete len:514 (+) Transcript_19655:107-1648(+)|eukprot:CAMPEP_0185761988 /NCGR_PEP_ID=MMETSP1174-20130828/20935_1 /TAXON_ID=35687 /ORGANISM="Dictyocha speculum, Strain CCMP1381" /LENGTH=513 /DNA_ID=CAMNT_0028443453 /DNA_START=107 /DNA_END=1648 /DNA_ORIENTATION=+
MWFLSVYKHPWQWANAQDLDGSITGLWDGAVLGAGDAGTASWNKTREWFRLDDSCELLFTEYSSRGYWACPTSGKYWALQKRTIVTVIPIKSDYELTIQAKDPPLFKWARAFSRVTKSDPSMVLAGTLYHFGHEDRRARIGWNGENAGKHVVGTCCDIGWYLDVDGGAPAAFQLQLDQMVPSGGLVFATRYPIGSNVTAQKCFGSSDETECKDLQKSLNKSDFYFDATGSKFYEETSFEDGSKTFFIKLVNEKNEWFDVKGAKILASDFYYQARYVVRSNKTGSVPFLLPPEDWIADVVSATATPTLVPPSSAPTSIAPTTQPPTMEPTLSPTQFEICYENIVTEKDSWYVCLGTTDFLGISRNAEVTADADSCYHSCIIDHGDIFNFFMLIQDTACKCYHDCTLKVKSGKTSSASSPWVDLDNGMIGERCVDDDDGEESSYEASVSNASVGFGLAGAVLAFGITAVIYRSLKARRNNGDPNLQMNEVSGNKAEIEMAVQDLADNSAQVRNPL